MSPRPTSDLIGRLLGPAGPEVGCDECFARLDEYVEAQLSRRDAAAIYPGVANHLEGCPTCRQDCESLLGYLTRPRTGRRR